MKIKLKGILLLIFIAYGIASSLPLYADGRILSHNIEIEFDVSRHSLKATDVLTVEVGTQKTFQCSLNKNLKIRSVRITGKIVRFKRLGLGNGSVEIFIPPEAQQSKEINIEVSYQGIIYEEITPESLKSQDPTKTTGIISEEGIYLGSDTHWYPNQPGSLSTYRVKTITPIEYEVVTHGALVERKTVNDKLHTTWEANHPTDVCMLVAGKYIVTSEEHNGTAIYTFFFPEEQELAATYIKAVKRYLDMYEEMLGDYPYTKFAVVENFFPTGYGMPSFTLLGRTVLKFPFVVNISLGHEVAHNWWGNSVFCDDKKGNWCEGLTTYCADYYYKELQGPQAAEAYRRGICRKYTSYVNEDNDFPLKDFVGRINQSSSAIGYGKAAMVFHMMRRMIGDEPFFDALRLVYKRKIWQYTTWTDFQFAFEEVSGRDFGWYFKQWVYLKGAPIITIGKVIENGYKIEAELLQEGQVFHLFVPVVLETEKGELLQTVECNSARTTITFTTDSPPVTLKIDPFNDLFRRLHSEEMPATINSVLGDKSLIVTYPAGADTPLREAYKDIIGHIIPDNKGVVMADRDVAKNEITKNSLLILGIPEDNAVLRELLAGLPEEVKLKTHSFILNGKEYSDNGAALLVCFKNPLNANKSICFFMGLDANGVELTGRKLVHYGKYSYLAFINGKNADKGTWDVKESPLIYSFH
ncbi:MAG: M1 family metallopeptidase [Candidatus Brocadiales bacterium]